MLGCPLLCLSGTSPWGMGSSLGSVSSVSASDGCSLEKGLEISSSRSGSQPGARPGNLALSLDLSQAGHTGFLSIFSFPFRALQTGLRVGLRDLENVP